MAGYSSTPLQKKLGIKPEMKITVLFAPPTYWDLISSLPKGIQQIENANVGTIDFVHLFVNNKNLFEREFFSCRDLMTKNGMLWVSWPKKSSKVTTDLDENLIREFGLRNGLVDVKVCAIDAIWSGLKFVYRLADR